MVADYDLIAGVYNRHWGARSRDRYFPVVEELILKRIGDDSSILEIGCGTGHLLRTISDLGYKATGVDISSEMIKAAKINAPAADFFECSGEKFISSAKYSAAICLFDTISHFSNLDQIELLFENIYQMLEPGGLFLFDVNDIEGFRKNWQGHIDVEDDQDMFLANCYFDDDQNVGVTEYTVGERKGTTRIPSNKIIAYYYSEEEFLFLLKRAGFQNIAVLNAMRHLGLVEQDGRKYFLIKKT